MNNISKVHDCYGCGVCATACGRKIIEIGLNENGFYEPHITDESLCTECGICTEVCAYLHDDLSLKEAEIHPYAAWSKDYLKKKGEGLVDIVEIKDIKSYVPENQSICLGQVLKESYSYEKTRLIIKEMAELLSLDLVKKNVVCDQIVLNVGYDIDSLKDYRGTVEKDRYGRNVPKSAHGSINLDLFTSSSKLIREAVLKLFDRIADKSLGVRRLNITANHIYPYNDHPKKAGSQIDLFSDEEVSVIDENDLKKEKNLQEALIKIKGKYGKNAVLRANSLEEGATAIERNESIGGHRA